MSTEALTLLCDGYALPLVGITLPHLQAIGFNPSYPVFLRATLVALSVGYSLLPFVIGAILISSWWLNVGGKSVIAADSEVNGKTESSSRNSVHLNSGLITVRRVSVLLLLSVALTAASAAEILKVVYAERRPVGSCVDSFGLPSGHAALSIAAFTFFLWEIVWTKRWAMPPLLRSVGGDVRFLGLPVFAQQAIGFLQRLRRTARGQAIIAAVTCLPVGPSRVILLDHSWRQVHMGSLLGFAIAAAAAVALDLFSFRKRLLLVDWRARGILNDSVVASVVEPMLPL